MLQTSTFTPVELEQYSRHLKLPGFGMEKQGQLKVAKVLLVGAGGLGCPIGLYLAAAGVGTIGVVDFDTVDRSNLQRQIAHSVEDIGQLKVESLVASMRAINPLLHYQKHPVRLNAENTLSLISGYDLVLDGSDNFSTRFLLADACYLAKIPLLQGAVYEYEAQLALFLPDTGPCYRCVFPEPPGASALAPCAEVGVLGVVPGTTGLMMATEAIKYLTGFTQSIQGKLLIYNALAQTIKQLRLSKNKKCALCGENPAILTLEESAVQCSSAIGNSEFEISQEQAKGLISKGVQLVDVREIHEFQTGHLPHAIHFPLSDLRELKSSSVLNKKQAVLIYCQKGQRSLQAALILYSMGYESVYSLAGGISAWDSLATLKV